VKKIGGFVFLVVALFLFINARRNLTADRKETTVLTRRMADSRQRESEISRLKNAVMMDNLAVADSFAKHTDQGPSLAMQAKDKADLGKLEKVEQVLGSAASQESALKGLQTHHWLIMAEFLGGGLIGLLGVGLMF
jgi:hypothetical protein